MAGVFLGIQLGNWNASRADSSAFQAALLQLDEEIDANRAIVDAYRATYEERMKTVQAAVRALEECSPGSDQIIVEGLQALRGTPGFYPRTESIRRLTEDSTFMRLQSPEQRQSIQELRRLLERVDDGSAFLEEVPFKDPIEKHPLVQYEKNALGNQQTWQFNRQITLAVPLEQACNDQSLKKKLYEYERVSFFTQRLAGLADSALDSATASLER